MIIQRLLTIGSICLLCFVLTNCNIKGKDANGQNHVVTKRIKKPAYEAAEESLLQLKKASSLALLAAMVAVKALCLK